MITNRCNTFWVDGGIHTKNGGKTYATCALRMMQFSLRFWSGYLHQPKKYYNDSLKIFSLSALELKAQVHYSDHELSVVCPSWSSQKPLNRIQRNLTGRLQHPLPSLCFSRWSKTQDGRPGLWFAETYFTSPPKPQIRIKWNLTGSKI